MTDAPDETTSPDATSDSATEPREHADRLPSGVAGEPIADPAAGGADRSDVTAVAAVPRPPRPGQRVPRRATAPSPRTAPAVVVAPTPPRVKSAPVVAPASRPSVGAAEDGGDSPSTTVRPPRVRRRTRVQRAAGSAETVPSTEGADGSEAADGAVPDGDPATQQDHAGLSELRGMFAEDDATTAVDAGHADPVHGDAAPEDDVAAPDPEDGSTVSSVEAEQVIDEIVETAQAESDPEPEPEPEPEREPEPGAELESEPLADAEPVVAPGPEEDATSVLEPAPADHPASASDTAVAADVQIAEDPVPDPPAVPEADGDTRTDGGGQPPVAAEASGGTATAAPPAAQEGREDAPASPAARAATVRTDSLTAPRSMRPGLAAMAETALTPSVRGERAAAPELGEDVLVIDGLTKRFDEKVAVDDIALTVRAGSFYGIVGPNGAGKTTTMSMVTGLLRPDAGTVTVNGIDVWREPLVAKRSIGVLPDRLRLFDRLTGAQLLHYSGALRGLDDAEIRSRSADLVAAFGLEDAVGRLVTDYSAGMTKKVALACAMIHSPRMLVLDEPFESVDPVSAANVVEILQDYVAHGGTVVLSSHGMDFIQRICDHVAIIVNGRVLAAGTMDEVRAGRSLEERFVALAGGRRTAEGFSWLHSFSD
ncbi:ATP-binding cassette domain-containing protein [Clavibacter sp. VKM Ac-2873]|uniref:ATP-binding cassette domain-containing protein n=1 Tax=Clavibacter sp. VKM Ac-2873 TaxID=2783813 RepID=UPI00351C3D54